jgi:hypothetical protein
MANLPNEQESMMTTTLHHAIKIAASRRDVFQALADAGKWRLGM